MFIVIFKKYNIADMSDYLMNEPTFYKGGGYISATMAMIMQIPQRSVRVIYVPRSMLKREADAWIKTRLFHTEDYKRNKRYYRYVQNPMVFKSDLEMQKLSNGVVIVWQTYRAEDCL